MKKVILIMLVAVLGISTASAQFEKGAKTLSANVTGLGLDFTKVKDADDTQINFGLMAKGSYFVIDNLAVTAGLGFDYEKEGDYDSSLFRFEVGGKYYFYQALYGGLAYEGSKAGKYTVSEPIEGIGVVEAEINPDMESWGKLEVGYTYYITENVFFEPALYYKMGFGDATKDISKFGLAVGIGVNF